MLAHKLVRQLSEVRRAGRLDFLRPDGKSQVSIEYVDGKPKRIEAVVVSTQHDDKISTEDLRHQVKKHIIDPVVPSHMVDSSTKYHINPTGRFVIGGPHGDTGLTGRKIIVDTYGGMGRHGGGAFSGKDPSKVDRSAAYAARWVAKHVVASGAARRCELQVAYAIGVARPVSVLVDTFGTEVVDPAKITGCVEELFDLRPAAIIEDLDLRRPIYRGTAAYGHFGRGEKEFTWEATPKVDDMKRALGL
jgi:S-adenosylmethionine synthetase